MRTVAQILAAKPDQTLYTTAPGTSVFDAASLMVDANVGALVVMDAGELVGLVTERDFLRHAREIALACDPLRVGDIMTTPVACAKIEHTSEQCMSMMTSIRQRHLPVQWSQKVRGIVSIGDLVKDIIDHQSFTIRQLELYITG